MAKPRKEVQETKRVQRTIQDVSNEYQRACMDLGHLQHRLVVAPKEIANLEERLERLDHEFEVVRQAAAEEEAKKKLEEAQKNKEKAN